MATAKKKMVHVRKHTRIPAFPAILAYFKASTYRVRTSFVWSNRHVQEGISMIVDPFRDFWQARAESFEAREAEHKAKIVSLEAEVARLQGPPLWRRIYESAFIQTLESLALAFLSWFLGAVMLAICLYFLALVCVTVLYGVTAAILTTMQVLLPPEAPLHRLYYDAGVVGAIYPPRYD